MLSRIYTAGLLSPSTDCPERLWSFHIGDTQKSSGHGPVQRAPSGCA